MTPKEKALELYDKYFFPHYIWEDNGYQVDEKLTYEVRKRFALIAVEEILEATVTEYQIQYDNGEWSREIGYRYSEFWQEVKKEIEKL